MEPVTEDDIHELKSDVSSWRCELLEILQRNGMDIGDAETKESSEYILFFYFSHYTFIVEFSILQKLGAEECPAIIIIIIIISVTINSKIKYSLTT